MSWRHDFNGYPYICDHAGQVPKAHSARYRAVPRGNVLIETVYFNVGTHTASGTARYRAVNTVLIESGSIRAANLPL